MIDLLIVGGGIVGVTIARLAEARGLGHIVCLDDRRPGAASPASMSVMVPSWYDYVTKTFGPDRVTAGLGVLDQLYGLHALEFQVHGKYPKIVHGHWTNTQAAIQWEAVRSGSVVAIDVTTRTVTLDNGTSLAAKKIVVAAGMWSGRLLAKWAGGVYGRWGVVFQFPDAEPQGCHIVPWAPYKQVVYVKHPTGDGLWSSDGSALVLRDNMLDRQQQSKARVVTLCPEPLALDTEGVRSLAGLRPYTAGGPIIEESYPGIWLATGGAKNGTLLAGIAAHTILGAS